jgi:hypothetical protein
VTVLGLLINLSLDKMGKKYSYPSKIAAESKLMTYVAPLKEV